MLVCLFVLFLFVFWGALAKGVGSYSERGAGGFGQEKGQEVGKEEKWGLPWVPRACVLL